MTINHDQVLQIFIQEVRELLESMEESLLQLENDPEDGDNIAATFRAAHTIKGSAGMFNYPAIVNFTHILEDILDQVRAEVLAIDAELVALLLESVDHLREMLAVIVIEGAELDEGALENEENLRQRLQVYQSTSTNLVTTGGETAASPVTVCEGDSVASELWHISLRFGADVFRNGMDPLSFLRYLNTLGRIVSITTLCDGMPAADAMDAETCYLGFEIDYESSADKQTIADVFSFVSDDCLIHILPPHSRLDEYIELIRNLPEDDARLGEILVQSGALTPQELEQGLTQQQENGDAPYIGEILVEQRSVEAELVQAALEKQTRVKAQKTREASYIRVQADKLDKLINLIGELVIAGAGANLIAQKSRDLSFYEATSLVTDLVEEIRDSALRLRMVPVGETFNRFHRVVRDVSNELGKDIELKINGADTEVDKSVAEKIIDPLVHLLRNSMDHGIETPEQRTALGKPARGTLTLNAYHDSGSIVIDITDDGRGLNREKILSKAIERGLVASGAHLSDQEIFNLIFEPGFSTADAVTNLSGRGVGMDVVKRNITELRGTVELQSQPGQGTRVQIRLPLTLAIIDGFLVGVGPANYVIPLDMVQECVEFSEEEQDNSGEISYLNLRGEVLPLIFLRKQFNIEEGRARRENIVVVRCAGYKAGLVVDELEGEFQTVIKPLGKMFSALQGISGSTILGNGTVALILDIPLLVRQIIQQETGSYGAVAASAGSVH